MKKKSGDLLDERHSENKQRKPIVEEILQVMSMFLWFRTQLLKK